MKKVLKKKAGKSDDKPAKKEFTVESATKAKADLSDQLTAKREEFHAFLKDTGLKKGKDYSKDKKHGGVFSKFEAEIAALEAERSKVVKFLSENKPEKGGKKSKAKAEKGAPREEKYNYPAAIAKMSKEEASEAKKKFRAECRAGAKRAKMSLDDFLKNAEDNLKKHPKGKSIVEINKEKKAARLAKEGKEEPAAAKPAKKGAKPNVAEVADAKPAKKKLLKKKED